MYFSVFVILLTKRTRKMIKKLFKMGGDCDFKRIHLVGITLSGLAVIFGIWYCITYFQIIPSKILPNPVDMIASYGDLVTEYNLIGNAWYSIKLNFMSYFYAILIAIPFGFFIALYPINNILIGKYINSVRYLPIPAMSGLFIAIFGLTFGMKVSFLTFALLIYILPAVANKVNDLQNPNNDKDYVYLQTIKTLGASNWQKFRYVYFPYVTRSISGEIINLTGISWSYVVICELLYKDGSISGIGAMINNMMRQSYIPEAYAILFVVILIGFGQDILLKWLDKMLFPSKYNKKPISLKKLFVK